MKKDRVNAKLNRKKTSVAMWIAACFFSVIVGFACSSVIVTGGNIEGFYNTGDVWKVSVDNISPYLVNVQYDEAEHEFLIADDQAKMILDSFMKENKWKYIKISLSDLSADFLNVNLNFYNKKNEMLGFETIQLLEGETTIQLSSDAFSNIQAEFLNQKGLSFSIDEFQILTRNFEVNMKQLLVFGIVFSFVCVVLLLLFHIYMEKKKLHVSFYFLIIGLQRLYIKFGELVPDLFRKISPRKKHWLRISILILLFVSLTGFNVFNIFMEYTLHKYVMLFFCSLLLILVCLSVEDELKVRNWNNPLVASWFILWSMVCVSDFVVEKRTPMFSFHGYIVIFLLGFLFFVWNQRNDKSLFWKEICRAVEGTFYAAVLFCLFCRPEAVGFRYIGAYKNPNPFALYLAVAGCIFLCEFDWYIRKTKGGDMKLLIFCCSMAAVGFFLYKTQCATAILAFMAAVLLWLAGYLWRGRYKKYKKRFFAVLFITVVLCIPVASGLQWGIRTLPHMLHTTVNYPGDMISIKNDHMMFTFSETVYAAESGDSEEKNIFSESRVLQKFKNINSLNKLLNGRIVNFETYLRELNLFGHDRWPRVYGSGSRYAHNGILAYAYTYGVFAAIPYIMMNLYFLYYAGLYWRRNRRVSGFAYLPLSTGLVFFLENMMDNVDISFHWIVWYIVVFMVGMLFDFQENSKLII